MPDGRPLAELFAPRSVAVFGANENVKGFGGRPLRNLLIHGYTGAIYPINPSRSKVQGLLCYPSLDGAPGAVDVALVALPAATALAALKQCAARGVGLAVVYSSGFAEADAEGVALQEELTRLARTSGMRILGPNGLGFLNVPDHVAASATVALERPHLKPGHISFVSQSGGMGFVSIYSRAHDAGIGYRHVVSSGNECDVTTEEMLEHFVEDPQTHVAVGLVEGIREPERFRRAAARAVHLGKPLVILKTGSSPEAAQVAVAHTAALSGDDQAISAVFEAHGILRVEDPDELWQLPNLLVTQPLPRGRKVGVLTSSGGLNGILADQLRAHDLALASFGDESLAVLRDWLPGYARAANPIDITGTFAGGPQEGEVYRDLLGVLDRDPAVDVVLVAMTIVRPEYDDVLLPVAEHIGQCSKPTVILALGGSISEMALRVVDKRGLPIFRTVSSCVRALGRLCDYGDFRRQYEHGERPNADRRPKQAPSSKQLASGSQSFEQTMRLLAEYGIRVPPWTVAANVAQAQQAAEELGYPVAIKAVGPGLLHKSDVGAVRTNLQAGDVAHAFEEVQWAASRASTGPLEGIVIQKMAVGTEVLVGVSRDPQFGPIVLVGSGGVLVELLNDIARAPLPIDRNDALRLLKKLRISRILQGFRHSPPGDTDALLDLIVQVGRLAIDYRDSLAALDLNPVLVGRKGQGVTAVDTLLIGR